MEQLDIGTKEGGLFKMTMDKGKIVVSDVKKQSGLCGFLCPYSDTEMSFNHCFNECETPCMSYPILSALAGKSREVIPGRYSVTEILNPPQQVYLQRNNPYYAPPEDLIWMTFGTAWHMVVEKEIPRLEERGFKDVFISEQKFEVPVGNGTLVGKIDLYDKDRDILSDYKTMKVYSAKKLKQGEWSDSTYHWQLNMYRVYGFPETQQMLLDCIIKDWSWQAQARDEIHATEQIDVPFLDDEVVRKKAELHINIHIANQLDPSKIAPCTDLWIPKSPRSPNYGKPLRCMHYCNVSRLCPQYQKWCKENDKIQK